MKQPSALSALVEALRVLPGVGPKSAQRMAYHLMQHDRAGAEKLGSSLLFATEHLRHGIDIRTLQQWMGHRDIASTMVYLKGLRNSDVQARINKGSLAAFA